MRFRSTTLALITTAMLGITLAPSAGASGPVFSYTPHHGPVGTIVVATGTGCQPGDEASIDLVSLPDSAHETDLDTVETQANKDGRWKVTFKIPKEAKVGQLQLYPDCFSSEDEELEELDEMDALEGDADLEAELDFEEDEPALYDGDYRFNVEKKKAAAKKALSHKKAGPKKGK